MYSQGETNIYVPTAKPKNREPNALFLASLPDRV